MYFKVLVDYRKKLFRKYFQLAFAKLSQVQKFNFLLDSLLLSEISKTETTDR